VPFGTVCCFKVNFVCAGGLAEINVCATTCDCSAKPVQPVPGLIEWTTLPDLHTVRFHVRWQNQDLVQPSAPVSGMMFSQEFGVFAENFGPIGPFTVPVIEPESFFDVFTEVSLSQLPPSTEKLRGAPFMQTESGIPCPPDYHWDGNVDIEWTGPKMSGQVNKHYGTLQVCPGDGNSYIHIRQMGCAIPPGATWSIKGVCPGFSATLVNEDFTPAPNPVPPGWTGWILVSANASVPFGTACCLQVNFICAGRLAVVDVCATACDCSKVGVPAGGLGTSFALRSVVPNPTTGTALISYEVPRAGRTRVEIFDPSGKRVRTLLDGTANPGVGFLAWDGRGDNGRVLNPGTYFVRLIWGDRATSRKVQLVR
jgi:hypothetical protein